MKHLTSLFDLRAADAEEILTRAARLKAAWSKGERPPLLAGRVLTQVFEKPSLRTRVSFEAAAMQLGGGSHFLTAGDAGLKGRECLSDVARVLSSYSDVIVMRTFSQALIEDFAAVARCPVINGLSDEHHPCQALTDLFTIREVLGDLSGKRLVFIGDGNNVASSLAVACSLFRMPMVACSPNGFALSPKFLKKLKQKVATAEVALTNDPHQAVQNADIVYTDVWASMGQEAEAERRGEVFAAYQINAALMAAAPKSCRFMHCLPAHRGSEVTDDVLDGKQSIVLQQAENRMHLAKGLLLWILGIQA